MSRRARSESQIGNSRTESNALHQKAKQHLTCARGDLWGNERVRKPLCFLAMAITCARLSAADSTCDLLIRNGTIYDGSGKPPFAGDVALAGDKIVAVGTLKHFKAKGE